MNIKSSYSAMVMGGRGQVYIIQRITTTYQANLAEAVSKSCRVQRRPRDGSKGLVSNYLRGNWSLLIFIDFIDP